ncbi:MAG TPA: hypothetical protein ACFYD3_02810 [Candidatus Hypogeohydataceae bacterium YC41]
MEQKRIKYGSEIIDEFLTKMEQDKNLTEIIKVIKQIRQNNRPLTDTRLEQELVKLRVETLGKHKENKEA